MVKFRCWQRGFTEYVSVNSGRGQPTKLQASEPKPRHVLWAVAKPFRATPALLGQGQGQGQDECGRWGWGPAMAVWVRGAQFFARGVRGALPPLDRKRVPHPPVAFTCLPPTTTASSSSRRLRYRFTSPSLIHAGPASARAPLPLPDAGARDALDGTPGLKARLSRTRTPPPSAPRGRV
jgi:hypothetical protein